MGTAWRPANIPVPPAHLAGVLGAVWLQRASPLPVSAGLRRLAAPLCTAGLLLAAASVRAAGSEHLARPRHLVTTGPYGVVRHPMYVAWALIHIGTGMAIGSRWTLVTAPIAATVVHIETVAEERRLRAAFPEEAAHYLESTPRYLPGPSQLHRVAASKY